MLRWQFLPQMRAANKFETGAEKCRNCHWCRNGRMSPCHSGSAGSARSMSPGIHLYPGTGVTSGNFLCIREYSLYIREYSLCVREYSLCIREYTLCVREYTLCIWEYTLSLWKYTYVSRNILIKSNLECIDVWEHLKYISINLIWE